MLSPLLAIIPVNSPTSAKRRLASLLRAELRAGLVKAMLGDVIEACRESRAVERILVVTPDPALAPPEVEVLVDAGRGHAAAVTVALAQCRAEGALVVMADCPLVRPETLDLLCDSAHPVAVAPAQDGGTNAIALRPPDILEPAFGVLDGSAVVVQRAERLGVHVAVVDDPLLALDVDRPEDVERVLDLGSGTGTGAFLRHALAAPAQLRDAR
jgi:2-phospho-L-lactate guanylyltransferase